MYTFDCNLDTRTVNLSVKTFGGTEVASGSTITTYTQELPLFSYLPYFLVNHHSKINPRKVPGSDSTRNRAKNLTKLKPRRVSAAFIAPNPARHTQVPTPSMVSSFFLSPFI